MRFPLFGCVLQNLSSLAALVAALVTLGLSGPTALGQAPKQPEDVAELDFSDQLPRIEPKSPDEAMKTFAQLDGFQLQLVASEPLLVDPIAISIDEQGRMYACCMRGYSEDDQLNLGQIRLLEDTDGDGKYDKSSTFADGLSWPTALCCYDGGIFVGVAPDLIFLKDTTGDGKADLKQVIFEGFRRSNVQGLMNSLTWGLDNRIHGATSSSGADLKTIGQQDAKNLSLNRRDFSFNPRTHEISAQSGGAQHGMSFDDWGRKFVCSNSNHIQLVMFEERYVKRTPSLAAPSATISIAADGPQAEVFRISPVEPWRVIRTKLRVAGAVPGPVEGGGRAAGYFTGSTGVTIYRGNAWPENLHGTALIGDVGSNIVHRKRLSPAGVALRAERMDEGKEFLASTDIWFRPAQMANVPDGTLYVLDMYREVIEHPKSLPPVIKKHLDLTSGRDRGRVWRVIPPGFKTPQPVNLADATTEQLVALLDHSNGWHRDTAGRLLFQKQDRAAVPSLEKLTHSGSPLGRMHALYALDGLSALTAETLIPRLDDEHPRVREHAVRLAERLAEKSPALRQAMLKRTTDEDIRVRYQLAFSLGELHDPAQWPALAELALRDGGDSWIRLAILSSVGTEPDQLFVELLKRMGTNDPSARNAQGVLTQLTELIASVGKEAQVAAVLKAAAALPAEQRPLAQQLLLALDAGLERKGSSLQPHLAKVPAAAKLVETVLQNAQSIVLNDKAPLSQRTAAAGLLSLGTFQQAKPTLAQLLDLRQPGQVQTAAIAALDGFNDPGVPDVLWAAWSGMSPKLRAQGLDMLFARNDRLLSLLAALEQGRVRPTDLDPLRIKQLKTHRQAEIRTQANRLLADVQLARRQDVVDSYSSSLKLTGDRERGAAMFKKICSACHKVENQGHEIGPNLAAMKNRGAESILLNVLDPNREVNPQFVNYLVQTDAGRALTGMIAAENANSITLKRAENKTDIVLREEIDVLESSGLSIMPEGMEKQISPQAMADLIAYLLSVK